MSYPVTKSTNQASSSSASAATATTTSSIHEYTCLFTHDLKRKSKRWQDGRLRHHVFNNRIMVYDDRGSSIGDAHLPPSSATPLEEGEEFDLDRGGAIVQICERVGEKEVDLRDLVDKRMREVEKRRKEAGQRSSAASQQRSQQLQHHQQQQRPLNTIMNTPARIGRAAIPRESPYEQRLQRESGTGGSSEGTGTTPGAPPAKRRKRSVSPPSKTGHARALFGTQITLSARPVSSWSQIRSNVLRDRTNVVGSSDGDGDATMTDKHGNDEGSGSPRMHEPLLKRHLPASSPASEDRPAEKAARPGKAARTVARHAAQVTQDSIDDADDLAIAEEAEEDSRPKKAVKASVKKSSSKKHAVSDEAVGSGRHDPVMVPDESCDEDDTMIEKRPRKPPATNKDNFDDIDQIPRENRPKKRKAKEKAASRDPVVADTSEPDLPEATLDKRKSQEASHRNPRADGRDQVSQKIVAEPTKRNEPRTELRIKSRKRRGLLMLSEKTSPEDNGNRDSATTVEATPPEQEESKTFEEWYTEGLSTGFGDEPKEENPPTVDKNEASDDREDEPVEEIRGHGTPLLQETSAQKNAPARTVSSPEIDDEASRKSSVPASPPFVSNRATKQRGSGKGSKSTSDSDSEIAEKPKRRRNRKAASPQLDADYDNASKKADSDWEEPAPSSPRPARTRITREKKDRASKTAEKAPAAKGPRTKRINKSCRSREIFGLNLPGLESMVPNLSASAAHSLGPSNVSSGKTAVSTAAEDMTPEQSSLLDKATAAATAAEEQAAERQAAERQAAERQAAERQAAEKARLDSNDYEAREQPERIDDGATKPVRVINPATRGRKAASKADAAGRAPQMIVPFDAAPERVAAPGLPVASASVAQKAPSAVKKDVTPLPGFSKANGGAWSRHAEDLLGMVRPKGRGGGR